MARMGWTRQSALPTAERKLLHMAIGEAARLAAEGEVAAGYRCLAAGLERAREMAAGRSRWANDLAEEYARAIHHYEDLVNDTGGAMRHLTYLPAPGGGTSIRVDRS